MTTNTENRHNAACKHCREPFHRRSGSTRNYCSDRCKKALARAEQKAKQSKPSKVEKYAARLLETSRGLWMIRQCRRSGSVETFKGATAADLHDLEDQLAYRKQRYGWIDEGHGHDKFHMCHVRPLHGTDGSVGLSYGSNLFVGPRALNQRQGNKPPAPWAGCSIPKASLSRKWLVQESDSDKDVFEKLRKLLGKELDTYLESLDAMPQRTKHLALVHKVHRRQKDGKYNPLDRLYTLDELLSLTLEQLQELETVQNGKESSRYDYSQLPTDYDFGVLYDGLQRFATILPPGQHRDNCAGLLPLLHVLGMLLAQRCYPEAVKRGCRFGIPNVRWVPLKYWYTRLGELDESERATEDADIANLMQHFREAAYAALQGYAVDLSLLKRRLLKRLDFVSLAPMPCVDRWDVDESWTDWTDDFLYLLGHSKRHWSLLADAGFISADDVADGPLHLVVNLHDAVITARADYAAWHTTGYRAYHKWDGEYPVELQLPDIDALLAAA